MAKHEIKDCPKCGGSFECKVGSVLQCECSTITVDAALQNYLKKKYDDCLCIRCLLQEQMEWNKSKAL
jgi:hypothetical protein